MTSLLRSWARSAASDATPVILGVAAAAVLCFDWQMSGSVDNVEPGVMRPAAIATNTVAEPSSAAGPSGSANFVPSDPGVAAAGAP